MNGWVFLCVCLLTFCLYLCLRKKRTGGILVTSRRVLHVSMRQNASGSIVEFSQAGYMIRHFAHETHNYKQPVFTCMDYLCCQPCFKCLLCIPNDPTARVKMYFVEYPASNIDISAGSAWGLCLSCCRCCCMPCLDLCASCCFNGGTGFKKNSLFLELNVSLETGYRKMANVLAAVLYYHPAKNIQLPEHGNGWNPVDDAPHPRLAAVDFDEKLDFEDYSQKGKVPVQKPPPEGGTIVGLVHGEILIDGYAGALRFCNWFTCLCCIATLSLHTCVSYCMWRNCARVRREFYLLTDRRLIRFSLLTSGASTQVRVWNENTGEDEITEFELEVSSWVLTSIHTYRYSQEWSCAACCGACCCCRKANYAVSLETYFGMVKLDGAGSEEGSTGTGPLEEFVRSLMRQSTESPLAHAIQDGSLSWDGFGQMKITEPDKDSDVYLNEANGERYIAHVKGWLRTGLLAKLCFCPFRILTCCCCPRVRKSDLYVTSHRMITAAQTSSPCCGVPLLNEVEYYSLNRVLRVRHNRLKECSFCGCCTCCLVNTISISTDRDFEYSKNGEETYVVGGDDSEGNVEGVPGADVAEKINLFVTIFSLLNTQDAWMLRKNVLDHNLGDQISEQSLCINRSEQAV